ncbi:MAG: NRAMP family divalent metal transporter [Streptosporangiaceae bacterium]
MTEAPVPGRGRCGPDGRRQNSGRALLRSIGPEVVSAASDNDPTNVGTAAAVGAQTGCQLSWVALLVAPLLGVVLTIAAQVGAVARDDLQSLTLKRYGRGAAVVLLVSVVVVNLVTIAADLQAGAAGIGLLAGVDSRWLVVPLAAALAGLLLAGKYEHVVAVLRYLLPGFLAFGAAAVLAHPDWPRLLEASLVPALSLRPSEMAGGLALLGTTLTSYVYVWETVGRGVEEQPPGGAPEGGGLARARAGAVIGAVFTAVILWCMLVASAATLGKHHQAAASAQDAAGALRPLAGPLAADLFAAGLVASAVVALPVLLATTAYVVGAHFNWRRGLSERISHARGFYAVLVASIGLALAVSLAGIPVIGMRVAASVIGGLGTPIGLVLLVRLARDPRVMGAQPISRRLAAAGWAVVVIVGGFGLLFVIGAVLGTF